MTRRYPPTRPARPVTETLESRTLLAVVPAGFSDTPSWVSGLSAATSMEFAPDGRLFVTQQTGQLRVIKNGALLTTPFLTKAVDSAGERGLLGVTFDPDFANNGFVYVYYTVPAAAGSPVHNRISRFTASAANPDVAAALSEVVLMDLDPLSNATNHNGGAIHFGPDGKLYAAVGENANRANAQVLTNRLGKMLRINADGSIPEDNPFYGTATGANRAIWALGLRNPFTFTFQPGTGRMFINDVGEVSFEEINEGRAGANYGWPTTEGDFNQATFPNLTRPIHAYPRSVGQVITGGAFYNPPVQNFPSSYVGDYFFADFGSDVIRKLEAPIPGPGQTATGFATQANGPVDLDVGPDGLLYYLSRDAGRVGRIRYNAAVAPTITTQPTDRTASAGQPATFTVVATGEPPLSYQWQRLAPATMTFVDVPGATSASYELTAAPADNGARFRVVVTNPFGSITSNEVMLTVQPAPGLRVEARRVFYNNSAFDGFDPAANAADDGAVGTDKQALLPGETSTFNNVTGYSRGLNGIMLDVFNGLNPAPPVVTAANFQFQTSRDGVTWEAGPAPREVTVRGMPIDFYRITVTFDDGAVANEWLRVLFAPVSDLPPDGGGGPINFDLFYFGNLAGETGDPVTGDPPALRITALDLAGTRQNMNTPLPGIENRFDFNRDRRVNALDLAVIRRNLGRQIDLFTAPPPPLGPTPASAALPPLWQEERDVPLA